VVAPRAAPRPRSGDRRARVEDGDRGDGGCDRWGCCGAGARTAARVRLLDDPATQDIARPLSACRRAGCIAARLGGREDCAARSVAGHRHRLPVRGRADPALSGGGSDSSRGAGGSGSAPRPAAQDGIGHRPARDRPVARNRARVVPARRCFVTSAVLAAVGRAHADRPRPRRDRPLPACPRPREQPPRPHLRSPFARGDLGRSRAVTRGLGRLVPCPSRGAHQEAPRGGGANPVAKISVVLRRLRTQGELLDRRVAIALRDASLAPDALGRPRGACGRRRGEPRGAAPLGGAAHARWACRGDRGVDPGDLCYDALPVPGGDPAGVARGARCGGFRCSADVRSRGRPDRRAAGLRLRGDTRRTRR